MFMLFIVLFSVMTTFFNFQATFLSNSPEIFGILTQKKWGMMLWIMSGTFKILIFLLKIWNINSFYSKKCRNQWLDEYTNISHKFRLLIHHSFLFLYRQTYICDTITRERGMSGGSWDTEWCNTHHTSSWEYWENTGPRKQCSTFD